MKHIVGFSGGIDSQAVARWVLNRYPSDDVVIVNTDAGGNEHPITTEHVAWYSKHVHPVVTIPAIVSDMWEGEDQPEKHGYQPTDILSFPLLRAEHRRAVRAVQKAKEKAYFVEDTMDADQFDAYIAACDDILAALKKGRT